VDPWGRVLVEGGAEPGLYVARLDLDEVEHARALFTFLEDRRPEVYGQAEEEADV
jgi:predicted amidohydrolase